MSAGRKGLLVANGGGGGLGTVQIRAGLGSEAGYWIINVIPSCLEAGYCIINDIPSHLDGRVLNQ